MNMPADLEHGQAQAEVLELDAEHDGRRGLQEEQDAAGGQELVDGRGAEQRGDHEHVQDHAEDGDAGDAGHGRDRERRVVDAVEEVHAVHAEHDQLGVADPDDVDDAEDEVEAEREEGEDAAQQDAVDERLEQVDVEDGHVGRRPGLRRRGRRLADRFAVEQLGGPARRCGCCPP